MQTSPSHKVLLIILDGFGIRNDTDFNAITHAQTTNWNNYTRNYAFGAIDASGESVGLPQKQFGNSEVGHMNIGAGRIVQQDITRIDLAIENGTFNTNPVFLNAFESTKSGCIHIMGLLSDGGVHSHILHILALIKLANNSTHINKIWLHIFLDGRDTPPQSAAKYLEQLNLELKTYHKASIATISGRYYAMDRDKRYDRLKIAYDAIMSGQSELHGTNTTDVLESSYKLGQNDEFVKPHVMNNYHGVNDGDSIIFANFRSDRAIQLTDSIIGKGFHHFSQKQIKLSNYVTITQYDSKFNAQVAYNPTKVSNTLGQYISKLGLHQLRIAETEKYPHVTYFFNGGVKEPYPNEDRILISSPRDVATYDEKPEMSLPEVTEQLVAEIKKNKYDFIITNFANGDMVGHSGNFDATIKAVNALDIAIGKCVSAMQAINGEVLIIADHGNCEEMFDYNSDQPHTQHTTNLVPCLYIGRKASIIPGGALKDVAPTLLEISGLDKPVEMTGHSLIKFINKKVSS
ncbi:MAG: 2,3-bisphosphoglycerate-independent phosphoglycerate mutase [Proteobacteria bacterium]|jgi:2,3-bisphosphoglycerate-independent phosphoglycerate mutase|nr:2,3-bisphosphoglycerate-independent phosphoglycerate mutase [Pseudomonadota bacterium]